ncbi:MAG TPA: serine/threonine protein phosphatase [Clostridiales bacterium]|nr:serine/threonine protein phosphatase [Clostridiales bacterium]
MIYSISDLHLGSCVDKPMDVFGKKWEGHFDKIRLDWMKKVREEDVVLLAGDLSWAMTLEEVKQDLAALAALPGKKVLLKGNHDYWWQSISKVKGILPENVYALQNDVLRLGKYLICGSRGWTSEKQTEEDKKIYDRELIRLELSLSAMSKERKEGDVVIGMTHYPPFDVSLENTPVTDLFTKYEVEKVVYGHLHGNAYAKRKVFIHKTAYYLTSCDLLDFALAEIAD